ncbi:MAG: hypothetical protein JWN43_2302 [Gammaproteobacteria bacterium]|nr:hypothetical protein [Gammaproteobacteria bacterium]
MPYSPNPEFKALYSLFTPDPGSIGAHLNALNARFSKDDPLLIATGSDIVIFPGAGRAPLTESFRLSTRGFVELTSVSHLGVAVPYIIRMRELGDPAWEKYAGQLMAQTAKVRAVNTEAYWRDTVAVEAWLGLEDKIADLVDYSCKVTLAYLSKCLKDPGYLTFDYLRDQFLDPVGSAEVPVPINDMMIGTFGLVSLDIGHRIIRWLQAEDFAWERMMVVISGRAGRPTAALTWPTNNMCHLLWQASGQKLPPERLYIAAHAPGLDLESVRNEAAREKLEAQYRQIWFSTRTTVEMGRAMFEGYPAFRPVINSAPVVDDTTQWIGELPTVRSPDDRRGVITRLRFVMEDPAQQLSNASAHYIIDQLCAVNNRPADVVVPGFTNLTYPKRAPAI